MRIRFTFYGLLLALLFHACSTDVDLYADYKDMTVIYGFINANADTNFFRITKTFCGTNDDPINALEVAKVYDSSNYPGKLNAYFEELKSISGHPYQPSGRQLQLDTLTLHNKYDGLFYAPHQKLYYTTERFNINDGNEKYRYKLYVIKPDGDTVTSETGVVDGRISVGQATVFFQSAPSNRRSRLLFTSTEEAVLYEIGMQFNYWEGHGGEPLTSKNVTWSYGMRPLGAYEKVGDVENLYGLSYSVNSLFDQLEQAIGSDTVWDVNHPNVVRYIDDFYIFITAAGKDFYNYYQCFEAIQGGLNLSTEYTNVNGGCGFLSSRVFLKHKVLLSSGAKYDLICKPWGFCER